MHRTIYIYAYDIYIYHPDNPYNCIYFHRVVPTASGSPHRLRWGYPKTCRHHVSDPDLVTYLIFEDDGVSLPDRTQNNPYQSFGKIYRTVKVRHL